MATPRHRIGRFVAAHADKLAPLLLHLELKCQTDDDADVGERFAKLHAAQNKDFEGQYQALVSYIEAGPSFAEAAEAWIATCHADPMRAEHKAVEAHPVVASVLENAFGATDARRMMSGLPEFVSLLNRRTEPPQPVISEAAQRTMLGLPDFISMLSRPSNARPPQFIALVQRRSSSRSERSRNRERSPRRTRSQSPRRDTVHVESIKERLRRTVNGSPSAMRELVNWLLKELQDIAIGRRGATSLEHPADTTVLMEVANTEDRTERLTRMLAWMDDHPRRMSAVETWLEEQ